MAISIGLQSQAAVETLSLERNGVRIPIQIGIQRGPDGDSLQLVYDACLVPDDAQLMFTIAKDPASPGNLIHPTPTENGLHWRPAMSRWRLMLRSDYFLRAHLVFDYGEWITSPARRIRLSWQSPVNGSGDPQKVPENAPIVSASGRPTLI